MEPEKNSYLLQSHNKPCHKRIMVTPKAYERLLQLREAEQAVNTSLEPRFRIRVESGGCFGFQYHFNFDLEQNEDDYIFAVSPLEIIVDELSLGFLDGVALDYVEDLMGASFQLKNPNATSSCGCGNSFAI